MLSLLWAQRDSRQLTENDLPDLFSDLQMTIHAHRQNRRGVLIGSGGANTLKIGQKIRKIRNNSGKNRRLFIVLDTE